MADVFISYKKEDRALAQRVETALNAAGLSCWWDTSLHPRESWDAIIQREIAEAAAVVVIWTSRSVQSEWVRIEANYGKQHKKLVPLLAEPCDIPLAFSLTQAANITDWFGDASHQGWRQVLEWIEALKDADHGPDLLEPEASSDRRSSAEVDELRRELKRLQDKVGGSIPVVQAVRNQGAARLQSAADQDERRKRWMFGLAAIAILIAGFIATIMWIGAASDDTQNNIAAEIGRSSNTIAEDDQPEAGDRYNPGQSFRDMLSSSGQGPEMVVVPSGSFIMGSHESEAERGRNESPQRAVEIEYQFAVGKYEVTWAEWEACVADGGCNNGPVLDAGGDNGWGRNNRPVIEVDWNDSQAYVEWLSRKTGERYRLLSEAEWEYVARAGTISSYFWGNNANTGCAYMNGPDVTAKRRNRQWRTVTCDDGFLNSSPVGSHRANPFGLYDMSGNVWEWVEDCYENDYFSAPANGSAHVVVDCAERVHRGGSWGHNPTYLRSAHRRRDDPTFRSSIIGFRVARDLD